ncbi:hypothetical protein [Malaciobacter mytili]|uniref:FAD/FMN-containing dehydrogenase n=1 Tax=Malaciobacter mytili LMG 24559 TaxID=1032238 RepID=A0AAX2AEH4_9BACT|nr:hypothetical protein [Malaciobacter mytili]AXH16280.1 hypothetical protein AMYT_2757 [Malaciobacter mytili LMG 24559]RXI37059.1 hypothetical protein CRU99_12635 [Malaciobacter mytili]RXK13793.1 hypothetical protein CP985_12660 [Malaciobacter mytili LMG 24559]
MKKFLLLITLLVCTYAQEFTLNTKIQNFSLANQFDEKRTITNNIQTIIVSFEKDTGKEINEFLNEKQPDFLQKHNAVFIANISGMPMFVTKMFALPKMRSYKHEILLIYDENDKRFIAKEGNSTLYKLENGVIKSIKFITKDDLAKVF